MEKYPIRAVVKTAPDDDMCKQFDSLNTTMNIAQAAINTLAGKCLCDAFDLLAKHSLYHSSNIKRYANLAKRKYYDYEKLHSSNFGDRYQLFLDYLDAVEDIMSPHLNVLFWAVKRVLDKYKQSDTVLKTKVMIARTMIELSCSVFDDILSESQKHTGHDFTKYMRPARLTGCLSFWDNVTNALCVTHKGQPDINLNADSDVALAVKIIRTKLSDADTLNRAGYYALKLNPDIVEKYAKDDYRYLQDLYGFAFENP